MEWISETSGFLFRFGLAPFTHRHPDTNRGLMTHRMGQKHGIPTARYLCRQMARFASFLVLCSFLINCASKQRPKLQSVVAKTVTLRGSNEEVWSALTAERELAKWWNQGVRLEPQVDGDFYEPWGEGQLATGRVLEVVPLKILRFQWKEKTWLPHQDTICEFSLQSRKNGTTLTVRHSGWEVFQDSEAAMKDGFSKGWDGLLQKLKNHFIKGTL